MPNLVNQMITKELEQAFESVEGMVLVSFNGLTVEETEDIRGKLSSEGVQFRMVRNNLAKRVLSGRGLDFPEGTFSGNVAIAYGEAEQTIAAAKVFSGPEVKKAGKVKFRAGLLEGKVLEAQDTAALASIPDRPGLQAQLLGCISGPARGLVGTLAALPGSVARVVQAHVDAGGGVEEETPAEAPADSPAEGGAE